MCGVASASHNRLNASEMVNAASVPSADDGQCVPGCRTSRSCPQGQICENGQCQPDVECTVDADCINPGTICNRAINVCIDGCRSDEQCPAGSSCQNLLCVLDPAFGAARLIQIVQCQARSVIGRLTSVIEGCRGDAPVSCGVELPKPDLC